MNVNERYEKLLSLMAEYDAAEVSSIQRQEYGRRLDKEGSKLSERDFWNVVLEYKKCLEK